MMGSLTQTTTCCILKLTGSLIATGNNEWLIPTMCTIDLEPETN